MIPRRTLPPNALVLALSPLLDPRSVGALLDLRARGSRPRGDRRLARAVHAAAGARPRRVAYDIWTLRRDALRHRLQQRRRRGRRVGQRAAPAGRPRGGAGIQALRPARARLITALGALLALARHVRLRSRDAPAGSRRSRSSPARSPSALLALGLVLRWPSMIPWAIVLAGAGYLTAREGQDLVDGWAAVDRRAAARSRPSSHRGRSSTTRGSAPSRRSPFAAP